MRQKKHQPKFKVGDKVRHVWGNEVCPVTEVTDKGYQIKGEGFVSFDYEELWELVEQPKFKVGDIIRVKEGEVRLEITNICDGVYWASPEGLNNKHLFDIRFTEEDNFELVEESKPKFKIGDRVKRKVGDPHNPATEFVYTVTEIDNDIYHKYCLDHNDHESWIPISEQDNLELVEEPRSKLKLGVDLNDELRIDTLWKDTLANLVGGVTQRNTDSFVWLIDETLKFMDCGAYDEMACNGMRLFAKELKKRVGHED